jgi:DNA replication licensing factor MCM5
VLGISSLFNSGGRNQAGSAAVRTPYIRVVGIQVDSDGVGRAGSTFTPQEEEQFHELAREPDIFDKMAKSIAPAISGGYTVDIKKALACLLFGGSRKMLPDGMKLRGDINVLLLGDPSTAKSQFLKFVEKVAPVGVYTSGKGSSAAGLTASVIRDAKGEFFLEGGAMVLADGGVVCIDEFDKMRESDRVAIHEAMEQQTISVAKAGITTILNSRSSVLAAANPIYGRYDDMKSTAENIDLMITILSRFDLIFVVRDVRDETKDRAIAKHVLGIHINSAISEDADSEVDIATMKKYIKYCRMRCAPRLSEEGAAALGNQYVAIREEVDRRRRESGEASAVPITVRQLEALIRISESLAKMTLSHEASAEHVAEAIRLFKVSTMSAATSESNGVGVEGSMRPEMAKEVGTVEEQLRRRIMIGSNANTSKLQEEFRARGFSAFSIDRAISILVRRGEFNFRNQNRLLTRLK